MKPTMKEIREAEEQERKAGEALVRIFVLRLDRKEKYDPPRYQTTWGNKTALGVFRTIRRIVKMAEVGETIEV